MDINHFIERVPFLYHLTDRQNFDFIIEQRKLYSTVELFRMADEENDEILYQRRGDHAEITVKGRIVRIRDQKKLTNALGRSLTDNWTTADFIYHLNNRVFTWPSIKRLKAHFAAYEHENPSILRFDIKDALALNKDVQLSYINSGDSRCIAYYGGNPVPRGPGTFKRISQYSDPTIAEVTFPQNFLLPDDFYVASSPDGPWRKFSINR